MKIIMKLKNTELARHYGVHRDTVARWRKKMDLEGDLDFDQVLSLLEYCNDYKIGKSFKLVKKSYTKGQFITTFKREAKNISKIK